MKTVKGFATARIKLLANNIDLTKISSEEHEGLRGETDNEIGDERNDHVTIFPIEKTKENEHDYLATLFYIVTKLGVHPNYDDLTLDYRYYTVSKELELALNHSNDTNDWCEYILIDIDDLKEEEHDFLLNWTIANATEKIETFALNQFSELLNAKELGSEFDFFGSDGKYSLSMRFETENRIYKFEIDDIYDLGAEVGVTIFTDSESEHILAVE